MPRETDAAALEALALYNYGHYTSMLVTGGGVRGLGLHRHRLVADSTEMFGKPIDSDEALHEAVALLRHRDGDMVVRITVYAADFSMQHPAEAGDLRILVTGRPAPVAPSEPVVLATVPFARELAHVKHVGLFGQLWSRRTAQLAGYDDAVLVSPAGRILEGATWNLGFIRPNGDIVWPESDALLGVTQTLVRTEFEREQPGKSTDSIVRTADLSSFAAAFTTNAVSGVRPVSRINERQFDTDVPTLDLLRRYYEEITPDPM